MVELSRLLQELRPALLRGSEWVLGKPGGMAFALVAAPLECTPAVVQRVEPRRRAGAQVVGRADGLVESANTAGDPDTIRVGNVVSGTIPNLPAATITNIFANPTGFYYNLHNGPFPNGAVRDQLPEPGAIGLLGIGVVGLLARRRRARMA